jgi:hypothetical protein
MLYEFDRCTGQLFNEQYESPETGFPNYIPGVAFSPSSTYLFMTFGLEIVQYDMQLNDILLSGDTIISMPFDMSTNNTRPMQMRLGPDGRIYVMNLGASDFIHGIPHPNRPGKACGAAFNNVPIPGSARWTIPYHPNYRLGPLDGSACDTLGLGQALAVPDEVLDFGEVAVGLSPVQELVVRNPGQDTLVMDYIGIDSAMFTYLGTLPIAVLPGDSVALPFQFTPPGIDSFDGEARVFHNGIFGMSGIWLRGVGVENTGVLAPAPSRISDLRLYPNPASDRLTLAWEQAPVAVQVHNALGVLVREESVAAGCALLHLDVSALPAGYYTAQCRYADGGRGAAVGWVKR